MSCSLCIKPAKYNCLVWCARLFDLPLVRRLFCSRLYISLFGWNKNILHLRFLTFIPIEAVNSCFDVSPTELFVCSVACLSGRIDCNPEIAFAPPPRHDWDIMAWNPHMHIVAYFGLCEYRRGIDWWMYSQTTHVYHSELHFTDHWHTQTSVLSLLQSPVAVSWQWCLPREIPQFPALRSSCHSRPCRTLVNWQLN
jgi:hypothetical protein